MPFKVHPSIGVARVGNSPSGWFVGPETIAEPAPPPDGYKDLACCIKRQAARFRVYEYAVDALGEHQLLGEVTSTNAQLAWTVELAHRKRHVITPTPRTLNGPNQAAVFDDGEVIVSGHVEATVVLGEVRTEADGRLLVLGGFGVAEEIDGEWYDDTSDGRVSVTVTRDGKSEEASPGWVIVGPPDYAPAVRPCLSLYDRLWQFYVESGVALPASLGLSFRRDIYPLLRARADVPAVNGGAAVALDESSFPIPLAQRAALVALFTPIAPGAFDSTVENPNAITATRHQQLVTWQNDASGSAVNEDWGAPLAEPGPAELDRGPLSHCAGFPFAPGWEAGAFTVSSPDIYSEPFRFAASVLPGSVTQTMTVPWQGDIGACGAFFWVAQRPYLVTDTDGSWRHPWLPGGTAPLSDWSSYGLVLREGNELHSHGCDAFPRAKLDRFAESVRILFGVIDDGGGATDGGPVPPWEPFVQLLVTNLITRLSERLPAREGKAIRSAANEAAFKIAMARMKSAVAGARQGSRQR